MNLFRYFRPRRHAMGPYASIEDFCRIFTDDMGPLYWLALLLTGDRNKAEQCFVAGLEDCIQGNHVFSDWARSWARTAIVKRAIRIAQPRPREADTFVPAATTSPNRILPNAGNLQLLIERVLELEPFDRFVFIMTVLERYSEHDCSLLLGCTSQHVRDARIRAVGQMAPFRVREIENAQTA